MKDVAGRHSQHVGNGWEGPEDAGVSNGSPSIHYRREPAGQSGQRMKPRGTGCLLVTSSRDGPAAQPSHLPGPHRGAASSVLRTSVSWPVSPTELLTDTSQAQHLTFKKL